MELDAPSPLSEAAPGVTRVTPGPRFLLRLLGMSRFLVIIAVISIFMAATALLVYGAVETYRLIVQLIPGSGAPTTAKKLMLASIEITDLFLLAAALYVIAIGLYELFIDDRIPLLPAWLVITDIDDLKYKLISVIIAVLAVTFLGQVISWDGERNLQPFGIATGVVVAALTYFLNSKADKRKGSGSPE